MLLPFIFYKYKKYCSKYINEETLIHATEWINYTGIMLKKQKTVDIFKGKDQAKLEVTIKVNLGK